MNYPQEPDNAVFAQRGQALVLSTILASLALLAFTRYFYTGQVVSARAKQTHALDAATYSGALVQARALNMLAIMNRAQIGHHIAMAHLVTLGSWANLSGTEAQQLARGNPPAYLIGMLFGTDHGAAYLAAAQASGFRQLAGRQGGLGTAYAAHDRVVQSIFTDVQEHIVQSVPDARYETMATIIRKNYSDVNSDLNTATDAHFELVLHDDRWPGFLQRYAGNTLRPFLLQTGSLYPFLAPRDKTARNSWVVDARCPSRRHELRRRGNTQLDAQGRWQSIDTQSFHALRSNRWIGCYFREYTMGWGWIPGAATQSLGAPHVADPPSNFSHQDFWRWVKESTDWNIHSGSSNPLASSKAAADHQRWPGGGLQSYFDVRDLNDRPVGFSATLRYPGPDGLWITTKSSAETFFERPQARRDGRHERANLFRPYWQARLSPNALQDRSPEASQ